jgi:hypothetical protein
MCVLDCVVRQGLGKRSGSRPAAHSMFLGWNAGGLPGSWLRALTGLSSRTMFPAVGLVDLGGRNRSPKVSSNVCSLKESVEALGIKAKVRRLSRSFRVSEGLA